MCALPSGRIPCPEWVQVLVPDPRGVSRSGGGPHDMATAVADLEAIRRVTGVESWIVLGHSWGSDLAVRYASSIPTEFVGWLASRVMGCIAGHGLHRDREWSAAYEAGKTGEVAIPIDWVPEVRAALWGSFPDWIHQPRLWLDLANSPVPMTFIAAGCDIRPSWPLQQLAELVPGGVFEVVPSAVHDFWHTDPGLEHVAAKPASGATVNSWQSA